MSFQCETCVLCRLMSVMSQHRLSYVLCLDCSCVLCRLMSVMSQHRLSYVLCLDCSWSSVAMMPSSTTNFSLILSPQDNMYVLYVYMFSVHISLCMPFSALTLLVGQQEGHLDQNFGRLIAPVITPPLSPLAPIRSRMDTFWYWLTQVHLENGC